MATEKVIQAHELIFKRLRNYKLYIPDNLNDEDLSEFFGDLVELNVTGKADKVTSPTVGNFAGLDANGNLTDSGKSSTSFSSAGHLHDGRYPQKAGIETISALWTFNTTAGAAAFAIGDNSAGVVIAALNADLLDGKHGGEYSLSGHNHDNRYPQKAGDETITGTYTFNVEAGPPFIIGVNSADELVDGLNADLLDGLEAAAFALEDHNHGDIYYTEDEIDVFLALKIAKPTSSFADGEILLWDETTTKTFGLSGVNLSDLALLTNIATKYDEVAGANDNFPAFATSGTTLVDSGFAASDFAAASHNHDDRYFTETEMTNKSTAIQVAQTSQVDDGSGGTYFIIGSNNSNGAGVTPGGTVEVCINGTIYYLLTSATA